MGFYTNPSKLIDTHYIPLSFSVVCLYKTIGFINKQTVKHVYASLPHRPSIISNTRHAPVTNVTPVSAGKTKATPALGWLLLFCGGAHVKLLGLSLLAALVLVVEDSALERTHDAVAVVVGAINLEGVVVDAILGHLDCTCGHRRCLRHIYLALLAP